MPNRFVKYPIQRFGKNDLFKTKSERRRRSRLGLGSLVGDGGPWGVGLGGFTRPTSPVAVMQRPKNNKTRVSTGRTEGRGGERSGPRGSCVTVGRPGSLKWFHSLKRKEKRRRWQGPRSARMFRPRRHVYHMEAASAQRFTTGILTQAETQKKKRERWRGAGEPR